MAKGKSPKREKKKPKKVKLGKGLSSDAISVPESVQITGKKRRKREEPED